jgi:hypothetical protein
MSAPFRARAPGPVCGQLYEHDRLWRVRSPVLAFLLPFGCRRSLLGRPVPPRSSLAHWPTGWSVHRTGTGSPFRTGEIRPVSGASYTRGCSHMTEIANSATTTASSRELVSGATFHLPGSANEAYGGSHLPTLPAFPVTGDDQQPGLSPSFHPAVTSDACQERGRVLSTTRS